MMDEKSCRAILTTPPVITEHEAFTLTGNEYLSLPHRGSRGIDSLNVLHMAARGLLEFSGKSQNRCSHPLSLSTTGLLPWKGKPAGATAWTGSCFELETGEQLTVKGEIFTSRPPRRLLPPPLHQSFAKAVGNQSGLAGLLGLLQPHYL